MPQQRDYVTVEYNLDIPCSKNTEFMLTMEYMGDKGYDTSFTEAEFSLDGMTFTPLVDSKFTLPEDTDRFFIRAYILNDPPSDEDRKAKFIIEPLTCKGLFTQQDGLITVFNYKTCTIE